MREGNHGLCSASAAREREPASWPSVSGLRDETPISAVVRVSSRVAPEGARDVRVALIGTDNAPVWVGRIEAALRGLQVHVTSPHDAADECDMILVDPAARHHFDQALTNRHPSSPMRNAAVEFDPDGFGAQRALGSWLITALLICFMDARRTECLHFGRDAGVATGLIVFREGRIVWAEDATASTSLARSIVASTGVSPEVLSRVVHACISAKASLVDALVRHHDVDAGLLRAAFKCHLATVVAGLVRADRPSVRLSRQVRATPADLAFDVDEIIIEGFRAHQ